MNGSKPRLIETCDAPSGARPAPQSVLALPLRQVFAVPLWLATADPALMREMIFLQLERRGLSAGRSAHEMIFDYRVITTVENKTLVLAVALPGALPAHLCLDLREYEPSARALPLPHDEFTLWREDGRLVLAVMRGGTLAYVQALGDGSFTPAVLQELQCIKLQLESANTIERVSGITLWGEFTPGEISALREAMGLRVATAPRPAPELPADPMDLIPASVRQTQAAAKTMSRNLGFVAAGAGVYLLFLLFLVGRVAWYSIQAGRISAGLRDHADEVADMKAAAAQWNVLASAVDPDIYPEELLLRCAQPLPPEGVRFTLFSTGPGTIIIQGESANAKAAFQYADDLKKSPDLRDYKFEMPLPATLPNGSTKFQITGARYGATTH